MTHLRRSEEEGGDSHQLHAQHRLEQAEGKPPRGGRHSDVQRISGAPGGGIHRGGGVQLWHRAVRGGPVAGDPQRENKRMGRDRAGEVCATLMCL